MPTDPAEQRATELPAVAAATGTAVAMIAQQVIGKATRDALFLTHFSVERLPIAMIASALLSAAVVLLAGRLLARHGPARVVPWAFVLNALVCVGAWWIGQHHRPLAAALVYAHTTSIGVTLVSAFWSLVNERLDPHAAKGAVGQIGAGAALGGVLGGGAAWAAASSTGVRAMLLVMAALSLVCAAGTLRFARVTRAMVQTSQGPTRSGLEAMKATPYLRLLALVVVLGATMQSLLDFSLSVQATSSFGKGARLLSFFAAFQTVVGVVSFLMQSTLSRLSLETLGVGGTLLWLPLGVATSGALVASVPTLLTTTLQRGIEGVTRASLFRSGYEVLFTPIPQELKRPTKTLIDVGADRLGMMLGSALTLLVLGRPPAETLRLVAIAGVVVAVCQLGIVHRVHQGYVATLASRLRAGLLTLDTETTTDATTLHALSMTRQMPGRDELLAAIARSRESTAVSAPDDDTPPGDTHERLFHDLHSPDSAAVRRALGAGPDRLFPLSFELLELLHRDDIVHEVAGALTPLVPRLVGTIVDVVVDEQRPLATRRRAARLLRSEATQRVADELSRGLDVEAFDVRHVCARVLVGLRKQAPALSFDQASMLARVRLTLARPATDQHRLEHVCNLLSLVFPLEPMQLTYSALRSSKPSVRGVALEYLDALLPLDIRATFLHQLEAPAPQHTAPPETTARALDELYLSGELSRPDLDSH